MVDYSSMPGFGPVSYTPKQTVDPARQKAEAALRAVPGVLGVGEGHDHDNNPTWIAYLRDESVAEHLPEHLEGRTVVPATTGEITALRAK
jgi:hypothetical protein